MCHASGVRWRRKHPFVEMFVSEIKWINIHDRAEDTNVFADSHDLVYMYVVTFLSFYFFTVLKINLSSFRCVI
jgi:hypothetical protein